MTVSNIGDRAGRALLYPADATTGQTTGAVYRSRGAPRRDVGAWLALTHGAVRLAPGASAQVGFRLRVPRSVRPGQHLGGIVAENTSLRRAGEARRRNGRFRLNIRTLAVIAVQANLPGPQRTAMSLGAVRAGGARGGRQLLFVSLANTGTRMLKPTLELTVRTRDGRRLQTIRQALDTFLPVTRIQPPVAMRGRALPRGSYRADLLLTDGPRVLARGSRNFSVTDKQLRQTFGDDSPLVQGARHSWTAALPWVLAGAMACLLAFTLLRRRRAG